MKWNQDWIFNNIMCVLVWQFPIYIQFFFSFLFEKFSPFLIDITLVIYNSSFNTTTKMLQRKFLDNKCSGNDPGRVRERLLPPTDLINTTEPKIEPCGLENLINEPVSFHPHVLFSRICTLSLIIKEKDWKDYQNLQIWDEKYFVFMVSRNKQEIKSVINQWLCLKSEKIIRPRVRNAQQHYFFLDNRKVYLHFFVII